MRSREMGSGRCGDRLAPSTGGARGAGGRGAAGWSDGELLALARRGDHLAFASLIRRHDESMRRLAGRLVSGVAARDDALQDAYLKAYRGLGSFDGRSAFSTWLYTITYRTCLDHLRTRDRRHEVGLDEGVLPPSRDAAFDESVADRSALQQALRSLPVDQAAVVLLVDGEGLSYDEAAVVLDVAPGTVASRLSRARRALRQRLAADAEGGHR